MPNNKLSCGVLVLNERGQLLLGHSTGAHFWDLPKGLIDPGETPLACALREAQEEFGLRFAPDRLVDLGRHAYYRGKDLHLFVVSTTTQATRLADCRCSSHFEHPATGVSLPEIDAYTWADEADLPHLLAHSMHRLLCVRGLLAQAKTRRASP